MAEEEHLQVNDEVTLVLYGKDKKIKQVLGTSKKKRKRLEDFISTLLEVL